MVKRVERTKVCTACHEEKPWSEFFACKKWPDGTMRVPQSRCKLCAIRIRHVQRRASPDQWARHLAWHRDYVRRQDAERRAVRRERDRERQRRVRGITPDRFRSSRYMRGGVTLELLAPEPFADWLRWVMNRDGTKVRETAERLRMSDKTAREILKGCRQVDVGTVEQALIADDTVTLRELYPSLYELEAA